MALEHGTSGTVKILGRDPAALDAKEALDLRKKIGVAFQGGALFSSMTVGENIMLPLYEHTVLDRTTMEIMARLKLEVVGLAGFEDLMPAELSGGMVKRFLRVRGRRVASQNLDGARSTLLRHVMALEPGTSGTVKILGRDPAALDAKEALDLRKKIGVAFQGGALFSSMTVGENIMLPLYEHTVLDRTTMEIMARLKRHLGQKHPAAPRDGA